jgi:hypothetical protein
MAFRAAMEFAAFPVTPIMSSSYRLPSLFVMRRCTTPAKAVFDSRSQQKPRERTNRCPSSMTSAP